MVKSIVLDNMRFWGLILKRKNQRILLIHIISHKAIVSKAWHCKLCHHNLFCSPLLASRTIFLWRRGWIFSTTCLLFEKTKSFLISWGAVGKINNSHLLLLSQSLSIGHYSPASYLQFWNLTLDSEIKSLVLAASLYAVQTALRNQVDTCDPLTGVANESWRAEAENPLSGFWMSFWCRYLNLNTWTWFSNLKTTENFTALHELWKILL